MKKIGFNEIRKEFLDFFEDKMHTRLKSYSLIPEKDKSLLLINAGMAPLKEYFLGTNKMPQNRATSSQRCVRTGDIDNVGKTHRHATFFEMLGNFSFGDYFKKEAIHWAWEFLTENMELDPELLHITVYEEDDEAYDIWAKEIGVPNDRIQRLGKEDNFWELEEGPCGPCSEIHYDRGQAYEDAGDDRYMEIWNLVFPQFNKDREGNYHPLPNPNIDTGMGLERLALILEEADNIFELKTFRPLLQKIETISGKAYGEKGSYDESFRVIMDHAKAMSFLVYDGVIPSNEGRGYVLRRLIRRAYRHGKLLGIDGLFLGKVIQVVADIYQPEYPELKNDLDRVIKIVEREEKQFQATIDQGLSILNNVLDKLKEENKNKISGIDAFKLYDTYGFPLDLTKEIAKDAGFEVDEEGFEKQMQIQREKARSSRHFDGGWEEKDLDLSAYDKTEFAGYTDLVIQAKVMGLLQDGQDTTTLKSGEKGIVILDKTPFYAESGGQVGDRGHITADDLRAKILDTQKNADDVYYHFVEIQSGSLNSTQLVEASVDKARRLAIVKNHSATHLLHKALKEVLGSHINQAGSHVDEHRTRFDFTHFEAVSKDDLKIIEKHVNQAIFEAMPVSVTYTDLTGSQEMGAIGLFEDKYKETVRVVSMGDYSVELCGGCHVNSTSDIQMLKIVSEQGIAAGVRRIEAITGNNVYNYLNKLEAKTDAYASLLSTSNDNIELRIKELQENNKNLEKELSALRDAQDAKQAGDLTSQIIDKGDYKLLIQKFDEVTMDEMRNIADKIKDSVDDIVIVFASVLDGKLLFLSSVSKGLTKSGFDAGKIVKFVAQKTGGNGGGRPDFASAGGKDLTLLNDALKEVESFIDQR